MPDLRGRLRRTLTAATIAAALAFSFAAGALPTGVQPPPIAGRFSLMTLDGRHVTERSFYGKWLLVYFGYTFCPDVCPTQLAEVADALQRLGPSAKRWQPIFVTVDPLRDTAKETREYLKAFDPRILGLRGDPSEIEVAAKQFHVYYRARALGDGSYAVDHSSFLYVLDPRGRFVQILAGNMPGHDLANTLREIAK